MMRGFRSAFSIPLVLALAGTPFLRAGEVLTAADGLARQHLHYIYGFGDFHDGGVGCSGFVLVVLSEDLGLSVTDEGGEHVFYCTGKGYGVASDLGLTHGPLRTG